MNNKRFRNAYKDYQVREVRTSGGKTKREYVYTGTLYRMDVSDLNWYLIRVLQTLLFLAGVALFAVPAVQNLTVNINAVSAFPQALAVISFFVQLIALFQYWLSSREMTEEDIKRSSKLLKPFALISAVCCGIVFIISLIFLFVNSEATVRAVLLTFLYLLSGVVMLVSYIVESRVTFVAAE